jgi:hypothetical protein
VFGSADVTKRIEKLPEWPPDSLEAEIVALKAANPKRGIDWLRKQLGQPESRIREALGLPPLVRKPAKQDKTPAAAPEPAQGVPEGGGS